MFTDFSMIVFFGMCALLYALTNLFTHQIRSVFYRGENYPSHRTGTDGNNDNDVNFLCDLTEVMIGVLYIVICTYFKFFNTTINIDISTDSVWFSAMNSFLVMGVFYLNSLFWAILERCLCLS